MEEHAAHVGVGGTAATQVLDNNIADIPFALHFAPGEPTAHISASTFNKMTGNKVSTQINPTAISFGSSRNDCNEAHFITAHLGGMDDTDPLHTLGREFHISSNMSANAGEGTVSAAHAVAMPGTWQREMIKHHLQDLSGMHGADHLSAGHTDAISPEAAKMQVKQAVSWRNSVGASLSDVMHGCVTAEDNGKTRVSIPLDDSMEGDGRGQLAALCMRKASSLRDLMGDHHITSDLLNPVTNKMCKHAVVTEKAAKSAAAVLKKNLDPGPLGKGLTFSCRTASGNPPDNEVTLQGCFHRAPASIDGAKHVPGGPPLVHNMVTHVIGTGVAVPAASPAGATDALTSAMFDRSVRLRDVTPEHHATGIAPQATAQTLEIHGGAAHSGEAGGADAE
jgi:hypothetical protein